MIGSPLSTLRMRNARAATLGEFMLKKRGHALIDEIEKKGLPRDAIDRKLARRCGMRPLAAHFSRVYDLKVLNRMVLELERMLGVAEVKEPERKADRAKYSAMFTDKAVLQEVGRRNAERILAQAHAVLHSQQSPWLAVSWSNLWRRVLDFFL